MPRFFVDRPIVAIVIAVVTVVLGIVAAIIRLRMRRLLYPNVGS